ncbi:MAG TPA: exosortase/archaeosortase family protein [Syntrophales bacterium]|nr:exosortase/archaeosortase family protein [Syntrophales bacterium]
MTGTKKVYLNMALLFVITALLIATYYQMFVILVSEWTIIPEYSHGFIIPVIAVYMIWHISQEDAFTVLKPSNWGFLALFIGVLLLVTSMVGSEHFLQGLSLIVVLWSLSLYLGGVFIARRLIVPLGYLIFMIPFPSIIWNKFSLLLKLWVSSVTAFLLNHYGEIAFMHEGNIFTLSSGSLEVADACSGLRSLISMLALGVLIAFLSRYAVWKKLILLIATIPIALTANIMRLLLLVILADRYGLKITHGFLHSFSGFFVFFIGLLLLLGVHTLLALREPTVKRD